MNPTLRMITFENGRSMIIIMDQLRVLVTRMIYVSKISVARFSIASYLGAVYSRTTPLPLTDCSRITQGRTHDAAASDSATRSLVCCH